MATKLTTKFIEAVQPSPGRQASYPDAQVAGLELRVSPGGRKVWSFRYRNDEGKQRRLSLGAFPAVDLGDARDKAIKVLGALSDGTDPAAEKRRAKADARARVVTTFSDLADAYLAVCASGEWRPKGRRKRERTIKDETNILRRHVRGALGKALIAEVTRASVKKLLRDMLARGIGAQTNRTHAVIRQVFSWAIAEELVEANPATGFAPLASERPRVRVLSDAELKAVWRILAGRPNRLMIPGGEGEEGRPLYLSRPVGIILQLATLLLQRRAEVSGMRRAEVNLDEGVWIIPGERTKNGKPHMVPLPPRAVELIREALVLADASREAPAACVFPGRRDGSKPIRADSVTHALADVAKACGIEGITVHDLRRTGASAMASERLGQTPFIVSRVLGHSGDTGGAAAVTLTHYAIYDYAAEKRRALAAWDELLTKVVSDES